MKTIIRTTIYFIAIIGIGAWAWKNFSPVGQETAEAGKASSPDTETAALFSHSEHIVVVTYFTSDQRCKTCLEIERLTQKSVQQSFTKELANKEVIFQTINFDRPENKHYVEQYQLAFKTVVVSERIKGKEQQWSKYDKVWELVDKPTEFSAYLQDGIRQYLVQSPSSAPLSPQPDA